MDDRLNERLKKWDEQIEKVCKVEGEFFEMEGFEKSLEGQLFLTAPMAHTTIDAKTHYAHDSKDWRDFKKGLAAKRAEYNKERRILDLRIKAFEAEYLTMKIEGDIMKKGHGGQL